MVGFPNFTHQRLVTLSGGAESDRVNVLGVLLVRVNMIAPIWVWLKVKQEGQTAGSGPCFHLPGQPMLEFRFFCMNHSQKYIPERNRGRARRCVWWWTTCTLPARRWRKRCARRGGAIRSRCWIPGGGGAVVPVFLFW